MCVSLSLNHEKALCSNPHKERVSTFYIRATRFCVDITYRVRLVLWNEMSNPQHPPGLLLPRVPWCGHFET